MLHILINPTAGNGRAGRIGSEILGALAERGVTYTVSYTEHAGHATELAHKAAEAGAVTVVAVGGDGTVLETARGVYGTQAALGIIPAGTGNDVVKMLSIPKEPMQALDHLLSHPPRSTDVGHINGQLFLNVTGTGFDVVVLEYALTAKRYVRGILPYLWGVIRTIFTYRSVEVTVQMDDKPPITQPILLVAVANGRFIGGGIEVAPDAKPDDGLFDVVLIDHMPRRKMPFQLPKLLSGKILQIPGTLYERGRRVTISGKNIHMNIDGEIIPMETVNIEMESGGLQVHW